MAKYCSKIIIKTAYIILLMISLIVQGKRKGVFNWKHILVAKLTEFL